ncbi:MAG: hypothetical protein M3Z64_07145 [Verrucomicrobiota bacterium]|nr:hypothetical protein [Verrucomicrobiota bacterium]
MLKQDDFEYAIENTRVIVAPAQQIATFGSTSFQFHLITELMDQANAVRVRRGNIHAERPEIVTPDDYCRLLLEGFGEKAESYVERLRERIRNVAVLRYGFRFRKTDVTEQMFRDSISSVIAHTTREVERSDERRSAVIEGVDEGWEICLLKFTIDLIESSSRGNLGDFRRSGLL